MKIKSSIVPKLIKGTVGILVAITVVSVPIAIFAPVFMVVENLDKFQFLMGGIALFFGMSTLILCWTFSPYFFIENKSEQRSREE